MLLFYCFFFAVPLDIWDLGSLTRDQTHIPCIGRQSLNHWTTEEGPSCSSYYCCIASYSKP